MIDHDLQMVHTLLYHTLQISKHYMLLNPEINVPVHLRLNSSSCLYIVLEYCLQLELKPVARDGSGSAQKLSEVNCC